MITSMTIQYDVFVNDYVKIFLIRPSIFYVCRFKFTSHGIYDYDRLGE